MQKKINEKTSLFFPDNLVPDRNALEELQSLMEIEDTLNLLSAHSSFFSSNASLKSVVLTPDFHKGAGIPIGTVMLTEGFLLPQAMGNDINCGMRFYTTDLKEDSLLTVLPELEKKIRYIFFEGGRNIPMSGIQREAMFREGLTGILNTYKKAEEKGIWHLYKREEQEQALNRVAFQGSLLAEQTEGLSDFIGEANTLSYDDQIGSIGGGNHFVEVQKVMDIYDGQTALAWNLKKGDICIMLHTGSLMIGHHSGLLNQKLCQKIYPSRLEKPSNKIYPLPENPVYQEELNRFFRTTYNAANFAFANRLFLGLMLHQAFLDVIGDCSFELLYDSPHNFIWRKTIDGTSYFLHRKGACSANGITEMLEVPNSPFAYYGEPVFLPGSMGSSSYLLRGNGNPESLWSASHGAGRKLSRGEAIHGNEQAFLKFMKNFHIITPIDPKRSDIKGRKDILKKWEESIRSEAPYAYKDIDSIVDVHSEHQMASLVARFEPIFTIKA